MSDFARYDRQLRVPGFGETAQQQIQNSRVLLVGAGGLGFAVAAQLVGAGVGHIEIVDFDQVSLTNLHRQWLYTEDDLGDLKADVLVKHLKALNSEIVINAHTLRVSPENIQDLAKAATLIIDAADNFPTSYVLSDAAELNNVALVSASVNQRYGYVGTFSVNGSPSFRTVFPKSANEQTSCDSVGVSGPAVNVIAGLQAQAALDCLAHSEHSLAGKVLYVDLRKYTMNLLNCATAQEPTGARIELITAKQIQTQDWVIDVREADEVEESPQVFSVDQLCPLSLFDAKAVTTFGTTRTVIACKSGQRAMIAAQQLLNIGSPAVAVVMPSGASISAEAPSG